MGKTFTTSRVGNMVMANYDNSRTYALSFKDEVEAQFFMSELSAAQDDYNVNGRDKAERKKSMFANPEDCSVSMNFNTANTTEKWTMKAILKSVTEMNDFYKDVKFAIYGPMPSI